MPKIQDKVITPKRTVVTRKQVFARSRGKASAIIRQSTSKNIYMYANASVIVPLPKYLTIPPAESKTDENISL